MLSPLRLVTTIFLIAIGCAFVLAQSPNVPMGRAHAQIDFDDFAALRGLRLVGAAMDSGKVLRITPSKAQTSGAFWFSDKQQVSSGFETTFQFQLAHLDHNPFIHGADGFAFVLQNSGPDALGGRGSAAGFGADHWPPRRPGIPWAIAVFFDTYRNREEGDPCSNCISISANGGPRVVSWPPARLAFVRSLKVRLKDGKIHTARIVFHPPVLSVFLDGSVPPVLEAAVDLSTATDQQGRAWVGFTAATGDGWETHDILSWSLVRTEVSSTQYVVTEDILFPGSTCLPDRNLCTPERASIEQTGGNYHIVLPANLEWGVAIPARSGRPVVVTNVKGFVCWDHSVPASQGCGGPSGNGRAAGTGFLVEDKPAGALIMRTRDQRIWFSVNGRTGVAFQGNEGFYEFDLEIK
jgi:hypothetical protein